MSLFEDNKKRVIDDYERLINRKNAVADCYNGIYDRYVNPVLTADHAPYFWKYDMDPKTNPYFMERLGINAVLNSGALYMNGKYYLVARVEGNDRKSFFAVAESDKPTEGFRFHDYPVLLPDTEKEETNVYDMRLTQHEDGWIYGVFCSESKDKDSNDLSAAVAQAGIVRTKDLKTWERLPNLKSKSPQQRNVVLHPEFVDGKYAFYTRPQDDFIQTGSGISMIAVIIGAILNIGLDPLFIYVFGMGVTGAALATVISQAVSAFIIVGFLVSDKATLKIKPKYLKPDIKIIGSLFALGIAPFIMASTESLVGFVLNGSLSGYGDIYVSTLTVMQSAMQFAAVPLSGFAQGFVPIVSYNYGKGNTDRVRLCFKYSVIIMFSFFALTNLFMITFPEFVAGMFTDDTALIKTVGRMMPLFLTGMTIFGLQRTCQSMFVALGQAKISLFIALLRKVILLIPLALILPNFLGVEGVYLAESVADATSAICCTVIFALTFRKILKKREQT